MFNQALNPSQKNVMIILDRGNVLSTLQLDIGRSLAGFIIEGLSLDDYVSLLTLDSELLIAPNQDCGHWAKASATTKKSLHSHLNSISRMSYRSYDTIMALNKAKRLMMTDAVNHAETHLFFITTSNSIQSLGDFVKTCEDLMKDLDVVLHIYLMDNHRSADNDDNHDLSLIHI